MKKIITLFIILLALTACSKQDITVCVADEKELTSEITFESNKDVVKKMINKVIINFEKVGISDKSQKDELVNEIRKAFEFVKNTDGVSFEDEVMEETYTYSTFIDYDTIDKNDLVEIGILSEEENNIDFISLEKSIFNLKKVGYTCENK